MSDINVVTFAICNAFLNKSDNKIILPCPESIEKTSLNTIPEKTFGVFVTVRENKNKLYGCIGNFDVRKSLTQTSSMKKPELLKLIKYLSYQSANEDGRFQNPKKPLVENVNATFEISFMQSPTMKIDAKTGIFLFQGQLTNFQNDNFGIIYISTNGKTTTFLPNVFPGAGWTRIQEELIKKSGSKGGLDGKFLAYTTVKSKNSIRNTIFSDQYLSFYMTSSVHRIKNLFRKTDYVPYSIRNNKVFKNESAYVRNIATLYDLLRFNINGDSELEELIVKNMAKIYPFIEKSLSVNALQRTGKSLPGYSAVAFYLLCFIHIFSRQGELVDAMKRFLFKNIENMEREFELPECLIALSYVASGGEKKVLYRKLEELLAENQMKEDRIKKIKQKNQKEIFDSQSDYKFLRGVIFQKNWIAKYIYTLYRTIGLPDNFFQEKWISNLKKEMILFKKYFENQSMETNEIAVCFEGLCSLLYLEPSDDTTFDQVWNLFLQLNSRMENFLFYFIQDQTFRIDITGHVLNGIYVLILMNQKK